jgi:hypothetical protein
MRHEFFDTVLNNKESVDYVIQHLSKANDPELFTYTTTKFKTI